MPEVLLEARNLSRYFRLAGPWGRGPLLKAVDGVNLALFSGETLGLVGESGCGKSTLARLVLALLPPTQGQVFFDGEELTRLAAARLKALRKQFQIIFQDPYSSLNPRMTVGQILEEPFVIHGLGSREERQNWVKELLAEVGLEVEHLDRYPHEFSGGQRQRLGIARALALRPRLMVADEPVSALDVSIQAQIINLLEDLQHQMGLTYLFIAHDLSMVRHISSRVAVMYLGIIVELASTVELFHTPLHPYTQALLSAVPVPNPVLEEKRQRIILEGDVPSPANPPSGCRFRTRCPLAKELCAEQTPIWREISPDHWVACHFV
jgi:oligopeptide transport system ATP-binding protein